MEDIIKKLKEAREKRELLSLRQEIERKIVEIDKERARLDDRESELSDIELQRSYSVEFNSQSYASVYNTKLEKDKSILTLSVAGLGFLVTFINFTSSFNILDYFLFVISALSYLVCVFVVIKIFDENAEYLIDLMNDQEGWSDKELKLRRLDRKAMWSFYVGIVASVTLGVSVSMLQEKGVNSVSKKNDSQYQVANESFAGMSDLKKSFTGVSNMKPKPASGSSTTQAQNISSEKTQGNQK